VSLQSAYRLLILALVAAALGYFAYAQLQGHLEQRRYQALLGPDANRNGIPDDVDALIARIEDPVRRRRVAAAARALVRLVLPGEMSEDELRLAVRRYWQALDCLYLEYGEKMDAAERELLQRILDNPELARRYAERTARALEADWLKPTYPGALCPF